jgi:addiction module RelB/DinJ family antitoxin
MTITCSFRIEEETKKELDLICRELGMSTSTAFNMFAKRMVAERALPFTPAIVATPPKRPLDIALREAQRKTQGNEIGEDEVLAAVMEGRR